MSKENNILIAEFMGYEKILHTWYIPFLFENSIGIVPVSSSNSISLWPFLVDLISLTIRIRLKLL